MKTGVETVTIEPEFDGLKLDKWFKVNRPGVAFGKLSKMCRKGELRLDSKRVKPDTRVATGQLLRIPPLEYDAPTVGKAKPRLTDEDADLLESIVIYEDEDIIAINKPAGLAVQGGSGTTRHLDAMMAAWRKDCQPRLVHRLDRDTSGVLLFGKTLRATNALTLAFRDSVVQKTYWAIVVGRPPMMKGMIDAPLQKEASAGGERMEVSPGGQSALTAYQILDKAGKRAAWLALMPKTGRTHQLRVHTKHMGTPILGDGKYGGQDAFLEGLDLPKQVHLHARELLIPHREYDHLRITADLPPHMITTFGQLGFNMGDANELTEDAPWL